MFTSIISYLINANNLHQCCRLIQFIVPTILFCVKQISNQHPVIVGSFYKVNAANHYPLLTNDDYATKEVTGVEITEGKSETNNPQ